MSPIGSDIGSLAAAVAHGADPLAADKDRAHKVLGVVWDADSVSDRAPVLVSGRGQQVREGEEAARAAVARGLQRAELRALLDVPARIGRKKPSCVFVVRSPPDTAGITAIRGVVGTNCVQSPSCPG